MRKILYGIASLSFAVAIVAAGSTAFFFDQINSEGNILGAGGILLQLGAEYDTPNGTASVPMDETDKVLFTLSDLKPGDSGTIDFTTQVDESEAWLCGRVDADDNVLSGFVNVYWTLPEYTSNPDPLYNPPFTGMWLPYNDDVFTPTAFESSGPIQPATPYPFAMHYCFGEFDESNECQIDENETYDGAQLETVEVSLSLYAIQAANNPGFSCMSLNN